VTEPTARFTRPVFARLRRLCLGLPETSETVAWGHPTFRVGTKTFCTFEVIRDRPSIAFRVPATDIKRLVRLKPFFATPYGRGVWISRWLDGSIDWDEIAGLVDRSYRHTAIKKARHSPRQNVTRTEH
jgi:predicted DNA-binding protein (MmcQ/YjbR family)